MPNLRRLPPSGLCGWENVGAASGRQDRLTLNFRVLNSDLGQRLSAVSCQRYYSGQRYPYFIGHQLAASGESDPVSHLSDESVGG